MRTSNQHPDSLILLLVKLSIFFLLSLICLNSVHVKARALNNWNAKDTLSELQLKVRQIYTSQIGIREKQPNSGSAIEQYLRYVNLPKGNPWCAAFVCWVYGKAGVRNPRSGWTPDLFKADKVIWNRAESGKPKTEEKSYPETNPAGRFPPLAGVGGGLRNRSSPTTGDIFALYFPEKRRIAHAGFIDQWDGTWVLTVEGNTNVNGGREGDGVYRKRRLVRSVYKVARYIHQEPINIK